MQSVILVDVREIEVRNNLAHKSLEGLTDILKTETHSRKFE